MLSFSVGGGVGVVFPFAGFQRNGEKWSARGHLADYRVSRAWMIQAADLTVDTDCRTPAEIAHQIAAALPEPMRTNTP